jgi:hypothetical protein
MKGTEYGRTAAVQALLAAGADYTAHCSVPITDKVAWAFLILGSCDVLVAGQDKKPSD